MHKKIHSGMMLMLLLLGVLMLAPNLKIAQASTEPTIYVDPPSIVDPTLTPGSNFIVSVIVSDVEAEFGCYAWQVNMSFNPSILKFVDADEGEFLKGQPVTVFMWELKEGYVIIACMTLGVYPGVNGSGTLATIEFQVVGIGESILNITHPRTNLLELIPPPVPPGEEPLREIPCIKENGYFNNLPIAVSSTTDIEPDILNLRSRGRWITAYLELPKEHNVSDANISTVKLNGEIPAELHPTEVGDYDENGILDLMAKFDRQEVMALLSVGEATLTITGQLVDGTIFEGSDTIRVIDE